MNSIRTRLLVCLIACVLSFGFGGGPVQAESLSDMVRLSSLTVHTPTGVALDAEETLYVVEATDKRLAIIANNGERIAEINGFSQPKCVAVADSGQLYVSDAGLKNVAVFGPDLTFIGKLGIGNNEFLRPLGIAVSAAGDVYVVDSDRNQVRVYDANRQLKLQFGVSGSAAGQLRSPLSIAVDKGTNEIVVVDLPLVTGQYGPVEGSRVQFFDVTGRYLRGFGQNGTGEGKLTKAVAVAADHSGRIYVSETYQNVVEVFSRTGTYIETIHDPTARMRTPVGVAIGGISGRVFVSSVSLNRMDIFGQSIQHIINAESSAGGTISPRGAISVLHGAALNFQIEAETGYHISGLYVDGVNIGAVTEYQIPVVVADHTVRAEFDADEHIVLIETTGSGEVVPSGSVTVADQADLSLTFLPAPGFQVAAVMVDGVSGGGQNSYTLSNVRSAHTVQVVFEQASYLITATAGDHGAVTPSGAINIIHGSNATFSFTPQSNYRITGVTVDGTQMGPLASYTFTDISAGHDLRVSFAGITYSISASSSVGGSISPSGNIDVLAGSSRDFRFVPAQGHHLSKVLIDSEPIVTASPYSFVNLAGPHTIRAEFARNHYAITINSEGNGSAEPSNSIDVQYGDPLTVRFTAADGNHVAAVQVDGEAVSVADSYTWNNISANHTIAVIFALDNATPVAISGPDQDLSGGLITLNGANSFDPDGEIVTYLWEQTAGIRVTLTNQNQAITSFTAPETDANGASLQFRLSVTDDLGAISQDECLINLVRNNQPPVAEAGPDQTVSAGETVVLDGSDSMAYDGSSLSYQWQQTGGPAVALTGATSAVASFTAPGDTGDSPALSFRLLVIDNNGLMAANDCLVNIAAGTLPPIAVAGFDRIVREGETIVFNGSDSYDPDDDIRAYLWQQIQGTPPVSLINHPTAVASFIAPPVDVDGTVHRFRLAVTDAAGLVATDTVNVRIYKNVGAYCNTPLPGGFGDLQGKSKGNSISATIELPGAIPCDLIDINSIALTMINGRPIPAILRSGPIEITDHNRNGIPDLTVKFNRQELEAILTPGLSILTITGRLENGTEFQQEFSIDFM